jgi:hypothetical protein
MRWFALALLTWTAACWGQGEEPPGEPVGDFEASGLMVEQSCGGVIPAPDPLELDFQLRRETGGRAYWQGSGGPTYAGVERDGEYSFTVSQSYNVIPADRFRGYAGCSVTQRDLFTFVVEEVVEEPEDKQDEETESPTSLEPALLSLSGLQATEIEPVSGSDCTPAVAAGGGAFLALPCRVAYVLTGTGIAAVPDPDPEDE